MIDGAECFKIGSVKSLKLNDLVSYLKKEEPYELFEYIFILGK